MDPLHGNMECIRHRTFPDADTEVQGKEEEKEYHRKWCGAWIDARESETSEEMFAFFDEDDVRIDVEDAIQARGSGRLATTDLGKFRSACVRMLVSSAVAPAGTLAYEYLRSQTRVSFETEDDVLRGIGLLLLLRLSRAGRRFIRFCGVCGQRFYWSLGFGGGALRSDVRVRSEQRREGQRKSLCTRDGESEGSHGSDGRAGHPDSRGIV